MAEVSENYDIIEQWLEALRSGKYIKNQDMSYNTRLRSGDSYSAFGVFCDVYNKNGWSLEQGIYCYVSDIEDGDYAPEWYNYIPIQITEHLGMMSAFDMRTKLYENCGIRFHALTFSQIADEIEKLLL